MYMTFFAFNFSCSSDDDMVVVVGRKDISEVPIENAFLIEKFIKPKLFTDSELAPPVDIAIVICHEELKKLG